MYDITNPINQRVMMGRCNVRTINGNWIDCSVSASEGGIDTSVTVTLDDGGANHNITFMDKAAFRHFLLMLHNMDERLK